MVHTLHQGLPRKPEQENIHAPFRNTLSRPRPRRLRDRGAELVGTSTFVKELLRDGNRS